VDPRFLVDAHLDAAGEAALLVEDVPQLPVAACPHRLGAVVVVDVGLELQLRHRDRRQEEHRVIEERRVRRRLEHARVVIEDGRSARFQQLMRDRDLGIGVLLVHVFCGASDRVDQALGEVVLLDVSERLAANGRGVYAEALKRGLGLLPSKFAASDLRGRAARPVHAFQRVEDTRDPGGRLLRH